MADVAPPPGVDPYRLSTFLSVPESDITSLASISQPYVTSILEAIARKANEFDELRADKLRLEVELEQAVRTADSRVRSMKGQLDEALKETQELRAKVEKTESARAALENELMEYKSSRVSVDEEARNLRVRVQTLESDKRDTLEALDRKCNDYDKLQEEYTAVQHKNIATRRELGALETKLQQAESAQSNAKFRAQSLEQELDMVKKNNEWLDAELATKVKEHQKFRKEKAAQVSSLNSELEEAHSNADMLRRSMDSLKERYEDVSKKAEERLAKIKDLQSSAAAQEESFKQEINSQKRLAELYEKAMHTAKARVAEVEKIMEQELERFNVEIGHANSQVETERADKEEAEKRVAELEVEVERLEGELQAFNSGDYVPPASISPQGSINGSMSTPRRPTSAMGFRGTPGGSPMPFSTPAASRLEGKGMSVTRLYADFNQMKAKYETEKRRSAKLEAAVEDMMKDMEERAPEIEELRNEHSRMEKDLVEMSKLLEDASKERDQAKKETRRISGQISDYEREAALLRKQLRDLSLQIQVLTVEIERRDAGIQDLNAQQNRIYEEIISGNLRLEDSHDTDALISQRLVVFRTVAELQQQNADLLRAVRELGAKMEQEEQQHAKDKEASDNEEIRRLEGVVERLQSEMKNVILKSQTFVRERDMFRRMLQNKGELTQDGQPPASPAPPASDAGSTVLAEMQQNVAEALRTLQSQYDQFKTESLENQNTINEQNRNLSKQKSELEISVARLNSQLEMASERYEMLNGNFTMLKTENQELQKRLSQMHETQAKQDLKIQQTMEELVEKNSMLEGIRSESNQLKGEKSLWKSIEQRLSQDNEALTQERARLNALIANLQSIQSEHERTDSEARRRLVSQAEKLESELQATKRRLNEEIETTKKSLIRRENDQKEARERYDELNAKFAAAKEELVAAKTSRDHLQTRVNELTVDLEAANQKLAVYQEKPAAPAPTEEEEENVVEDLKLEVADLKKELEIKNRELEDMKEQVERFQSIAQANEEQLEELQAAYDQYKESMDQEIQQRENQIRDLQQRVEDMSNELSSVNQELSEARKSELEKLQQFENEKSILESQINSLKEDLEKTTAAAQYHQEDLRRQAGIAQEAQQNYERELVKHADAARTLQQLRTEYAELKNEVHSFKTEAETAKASLSFSESSWETQRENYQKELSEVRARCDDLIRQNKILHGQFDKVNEQMTELKKERAFRDEAMEVTPEGQSVDKSMEDLREVIRYLRQEKEIVDVQYELSLQETKRLKQQLDYARNQLEETKVQLATEKSKQGEQLRGVAEHKEIMEKISELNLLRESNSALRYEGEKKAKKVTELTTKIEELEAKIQPLEQSVRELEAEKEVKDAQMKLLNEDNERWKARTQQILQKYDRVDPAELEELKQKAATLEAERNDLQQKLEAVGTEKETQLQELASQWRTRIAKLKDDANSRITGMRTKTTELTQEVESLRKQLEASKASEQSSAMSTGEEVQRIREEKEKLEEEVKALQEKLAASEDQCNKHRTKAQQFYRELNDFKKEKQQITEEMAALRSEFENTKSELEKAKAELEAVKAKEQALLQQLASSGAETNGTVDEHTLARMQELQRQNEELQARAQATQPIQTVVDNTEEIEAEVQRRVAVIEANIQASLEAEVQRRVGEFQAVQGAEEGEVVDAGRPVSAPPVVEHAQVATAPQMSEEEFEAKVAARVEELLPARMEEKFAEREKVIQDRIKTAQSKFQEYKAVAVNKAVEECEAKHKVKEEGYKKRIAELEAEIANLTAEIEQLQAKVAELESRPATTAETGIKKEDMEAALAAKDAEHQAAIAALQATKPEAELEKAKESLRMEIQAEMMTIQQNIENAEVTPEAAAARDKEKEKLKAIISRNVEHRLNKEKEKWKAEIEAQRESLIDEKVQAALKERVAELETKMQEKEASLKAEMEKSKDAIRQEGVMRSKVQINMLERKNKMLEEKLKASQGGEQASTATPTASAGTTPAPTAAQPPHQQLPTGVRRPSSVGSAIPQPPSQAAQPQTQNQNQNLQAAQQAAIAAAEQATAGQQPPAAQRRGDHGTGPGMLRQLRGALMTSGIPRGGAMGAGRGRGSTQSSQAGSPTQPSQQQQQNPFAVATGQIAPTGIPNPFVATAGPQPASGIPNPFVAGGAQQQGRGGGIPRGRGAFAGRGRGGQQQVQTGGIPQPAQNAGSPTRSGAQLNPGARQFVPPGTKRTREGGDDDSGSEGKRARSSMGSGGSPPAGGVQQPGPQGQQGQQGQ